MIDLGTTFAELGISQYLQIFIDQGFDTWDAILDITESDFDVLGVKLGHRRKLQRRIANSRGLSSDTALLSPGAFPCDDRQTEELRARTPKCDHKEEAGPPPAKRKYRRHPKPDENAPERPPSAYVIFSNKMREELKGRNLSFTEIAKLVGENWQNLTISEKEPFEQQAIRSKERFNHELIAYKTTESYNEYAKYLVDFKARQTNRALASEVGFVKRPKLTTPSSRSSGTENSTANSLGTNNNIIRSLESSNGLLQSPIGRHSPPMPTSSNSLITAGIFGQTPDIAASSTSLPGYRESILGASNVPIQPLARRDGQRDDYSTMLARMGSTGDRGSPYMAASIEPLKHFDLQQHSRRETNELPPPLLSKCSSESTASSAFPEPTTPRDLPMERSLPLPIHPYPKSAFFDSTLPPLRFHGAQQPLNTVRIADYSPIIPTQNYMRGRSSSRTELEHMSLNDHILDPISALVRAGEIVNRNSQRSTAPSGSEPYVISTRQLL